MRPFLLLTVTLAAFVPLPAADWPMGGRDATRNAVSPEKDPPLDWDFGTRRSPARNIKWAAELGNHSVGAPVVAGGLVWVGTNNDRPRDPQAKGDAGVLMCFRESDGRFLYQYVAPRLPSRENDWPAQGLASSPLVEGDRLWFCTNRCETVCLDIGPLRRGQGEPRVVWKVDMARELGVSPHSFMIGSGASHCSPAPYQDFLYVTTTNGVAADQTTVPAPEAPSLVCFRKDTGRVVWQDHSSGKGILLAQQGSPLAAEIGGRAQVVTGQGDGWVRSFDAVTGKLLWKFDMNRKGAVWDLSGRGDRSFVLGTPVLYEGRIYVASGLDSERCVGPGRLCCIDPTKNGDVSSELHAGGRGKPNPNSGLV